MVRKWAGTILVGMMIVPMLLMSGCLNDRPSPPLGIATIHVIMREDATPILGGANFTKYDFPEIEISSVGRFSSNGGFMLIEGEHVAYEGVRITLQEPSRRNANEAVRLLNNRGDVRWAGRVPYAP